MDERHSHRRMRDVLDASALDAVVAISPENVFYLSDALILTQRYISDRLAVVVWSKGRAPTMIVCAIEESLTRQDSSIPDIRTYIEFQTSPVAVLADVLEEHGVARGRIGYERKAWTLDGYAELLDRLPGATWVPAERQFDLARMIKGEGEQRQLAHAARSTDAAIDTAFTRAAIGWSEKEIGDVIQAEMLAAGADYSPFLVLAAGENTKRVHHFPNADPMPVGGFWRGYYSDLARTAVVGRATEEQRDIYARLWAVQQEIIDSVRVGHRISDVYATGKRAFAKHNVPFAMTLLGHSLGVILHEYPIINGVTDEVIQPGMMFCVEPSCTAADGGRYHIEDLVRVTERGPDVVSRAGEWSHLPVIGG